MLAPAVRLVNILDNHTESFVKIYKKYGKTAIEKCLKYQNELFELGATYGDDCIDLIIRYDDEVVEGIRKYKDTFMNRYRDEGDAFVEEYLEKKGEVFENNYVQSNLKFGDNDLVYGPSANLKLRELQQKAGGKMLTDIGSPFDRNCDGWLSYSKIIMDETVAAGNKIHFDLTYMDDIDNVLDNVGPYANSITAGELRYIRDNWFRFEGSVKFYINEMEVLPPWMK